MKWEGKKSKKEENCTFMAYKLNFYAMALEWHIHCHGLKVPKNCQMTLPHQSLKYLQKLVLEAKTLNNL